MANKNSYNIMDLSPQIEGQTYDEAVQQENVLPYKNLISPTLNRAKSIGTFKLLGDLDMREGEGIGIAYLGFSIFNSNIRPSDDNTYNCGTAGKAWDEVHCYDVIDYCHNYDKKDAISLLKKVKAKGNTDKLDHSTLPDFIQKSGGRSLNRYVDLLSSAIKQLTKKVEDLENKLEKQNATI